MPDEFLPIDVREFLLRSINSVGQLEALILLQSMPRKDWSVADLARRLYVNEEEAANILIGLVSCGLAAKDGELFKYSVNNSQHQELVDKVARAYSTYLVPVTKLIHDKALSVRKFADAFKIRRDK